MPITSVTFNIAGDTINDPIAGPRIVGQLDAISPDFAELQECLCDELVAQISDRYELVTGPANKEVGIIYASDTWRELDQGTIELGNDDGWGTRVVRWARMGRINTDEEVYVYATHFCVPIRNQDDSCDASRQVEYARRIVDHMQSRAAAAVLGGDLNVFDGFESGPVVALLKERGLKDTLREVTQEPVITFEGNSWAPPGRIDYLFASQPAKILAASVATESASDHRPVIGTILFE